MASRDAYTRYCGNYHTKLENMSFEENVSILQLLSKNVF